ncbi:ADP-ribosylglycohydrolase family protein [Arthrobacter sp. E3]|uniref:ADP-ribosylglycohydrolase family protein n=1 Tax=Arthrobacter sp. E3 TaxID=517402 RepID=UPI001A93B40A|nr:ADP-ribosylglycohydrolase family protein [Arthrobacter sp. E3]
MKLTTAQLDRAAGVLVTTAVGDALGAGYEFGPALPATMPITMKGGGPFGFAPAEWTDDTSMAIVIATSLLDALDAGHSPAGARSLASMVTGWQDWAAGSKDVGAQTSSVLHRASQLMAEGSRPDEAAFVAARAHHEATGRSAGNGSLMRTAPLALAFLNSEADLWEAAAAVSTLTHYELDATEACQLWTAAIRHAVLTGELDVRVGLSWLTDERAELWRSRIAVAEASQPCDFTSNGWVVEAFQGAWSAIFHAVAANGVGPDSLRFALENAVRGGNDTDTVAAIAGGLIGAAAGYSAIPEEWRRKLHGWGADGERELMALALELVAGGRKFGTWPRIPAMDYGDWRGIGTVVQHPDDTEVWIGGSAQLPFLGSAEAATECGLPAALGEVSAVVSLCRIGRDDAPAVAAENHVTFWLVDSADPAENAHLEFVLRDAAQAVAQFRAEGHTVYLHCVQAESRTPTVAALYGALLGGSALESLDRVSRELPNPHPNAAFMEVLRHSDGQALGHTS